MLGEAHYKDRFKRILPSGVLNHFQQATEWLRSQCRWRATQMFRFVHKYYKRLDRCGKASAYNFDILSHFELTELITFCPQDDTFCQSAGTCLSRVFALPMGGPLSAQAADLHSLWCFHLQKQRFHVLGELRSTDAGYPIWVSSTSRVIALAHFKDNILVAAKGPGASWAMCDVCLLLQHAWSLRVLYPCINDHVSDCRLCCMTGELYALGIAMDWRRGWGTVYVHPSALTSSWQLKQGAPLQSSWAVTETGLSNLFTGVLMNCRPFLSAWSEYLMSAAAWLHISILCGHDKGMAVRATQKAIQHFHRYSPHDVLLSQEWVLYVSRCMPSTREEVRQRLWAWLQRHMPHGMGTGMLHGISHMPAPIQIGAVTGPTLVTPVRLFDCPHNGGGGRGSVACLFADLSGRR